MTLSKSSGNIKERTYLCSGESQVNFSKNIVNYFGHFKNKIKRIGIESNCSLCSKYRNPMYTELGVKSIQTLHMNGGFVIENLGFVYVT